jgi:type II secretion system protein I
MPGARCDAFTLIEVIAALAIVSIALLGLLHLHLVSIRMSDTAQTMAMAVLLAQEKISETLCGGPVPAGTKSGTAEANGSRLTWRTEVTNVDSLASYGLRSGLQQLRVDVVWREGSGARSVQMTTYVADNRLHEKQKQ